jgi:hypothetical protein
MAENTRKSSEATVGIEDTGSAPESILYKVDESPPWYLAILLGFQVSKLQMFLEVVGVSK